MKQLVISIFLFLTCSEVFGAAPGCTGKNLVEELKQRDPSSYQAIADEAGKIINSNAIFWKISKPGIAPSYLIGTAHVSDIRVTAMPSEASERLRSASTVALELAEIRSPQLLAIAIMKQARFMAMPDGKTLWDVIADEDEAFIRNNPNLPAGRQAVISAYQPWVVATMISIPLCEQMRKASGEPTLDEIIARTAVAENIPLVGLETVEDQLSVFAGMPMEQQVSFLVATARIGDQAADYFETLIDLYMQRKLSLLLPLSRRMEKMAGGNGESVAFMEQDLLEKRNVNMQKAALKLLEKGNAFIAVGALHLQGEHGLVELFRDSGYEVTPLN